MSDAEAADDHRPKCYDCGEQTRRKNLQPHPVHIDHEDGLGYDRVDVPLCGRCRRARMPTYRCQTCGAEYVDQDAAWHCCPEPREVLGP